MVARNGCKLPHMAAMLVHPLVLTTLPWGLVAVCPCRKGQASGWCDVRELEWGAPGYEQVVGKLAAQAPVDWVIAADCTYIDNVGAKRLPALMCTCTMCVCMCTVVGQLSLGLPRPC